MRLVHLALFLTVLGVPGSAWAFDFVLLAGSRDGWVVALHPDTFETVARIKLPDAAEGIASDDSGQRLLVRMARGPGKGCCGLFALDT